MTQPGWYPDPAGGPGKRYWDGQQWGDEILTTSAPPSPPTQPAGPVKKGNAFLWAGGLLSIVVLVALVGGSCASGGEKKSSTASSSSSARSTGSPSSSQPAPRSADAFYALLQQWGKRDGYAVGDRDEMVKYGNIACVSMANDPTMGTIGAGAELMDSYDVPRQLAGAIAVAADQALCLPRSTAPKSTAPSTTVKEQAGPIQGTTSALLSIDMPDGSQGVRNVNDFNKDGKPNRFETWEVPLSYDATMATLRQQLQPFAGPLDGIPWEEADSKGSAAAQNRYVDWWWGRDNQPLILVRIEETSDGDGAFIKGVRTDVWIERRD